MVPGGGRKHILRGSERPLRGYERHHSAAKRARKDGAGMGSVKMMGVKREPQTLAELMSQPDLVYPAPAWQPEPAPDQLAAEERKAAAQLSYDEALEILLQAERAIEGAGGSEYMTRDFQMRISGTNQEVIKNAAGMRSAAAGLVEEARTELQAAQAALSDILVARDRRHRI